jgi:hypothetical protein
VPPDPPIHPFETTFPGAVRRALVPASIQRQSAVKAEKKKAPDRSPIGRL